MACDGIDEGGGGIDRRTEFGRGFSEGEEGASGEDDRIVCGTGGRTGAGTALRGEVDRNDGDESLME